MLYKPRTFKVSIIVICQTLKTLKSFLVKAIYHKSPISKNLSDNPLKKKTNKQTKLQGVLKVENI